MWARAINRVHKKHDLLHSRDQSPGPTAGTDRRDRTEALLKRTGLGHLAKVFARALSFGEQQRLALARALAFSPHVLFLQCVPLCKFFLLNLK